MDRGHAAVGKLALGAVAAAESFRDAKAYASRRAESRARGHHSGPALAVSFAVITSSMPSLPRQRLCRPDIALALLEQEIEPVATHREGPPPPEIGRRIIEPHPQAWRPAGQGHGPQTRLAVCVMSHVVHQRGYPATRQGFQALAARGDPGR